MGLEAQHQQHPRLLLSHLPLDPGLTSTTPLFRSLLAMRRWTSAAIVGTCVQVLDLSLCKKRLCGHYQTNVVYVVLLLISCPLLTLALGRCAHLQHQHITDHY